MPVELVRGSNEAEHANPTLNAVEVAQHVLDSPEHVKRCASSSGVASFDVEVIAEHTADSDGADARYVSQSVVDGYERSIRIEVTRKVGNSWQREPQLSQTGRDARWCRSHTVYCIMRDAGCATPGPWPTAPDRPRPAGNPSLPPERQGLEMDFGVLVPGDLNPSDLVDMARTMEQLGYHDLFHADERFFRDVYTLLAPLAGATSRLRFGPLTTDPYSRHPAITAMAIATLAEMSEGRALLGIGPGSSGFQTIGIDRSRVVAHLREAIELIRLLLQSEENVTYEGSTVRFVNDRLGFGPIPHVPIVIGTRGPNVLTLAGEVADQIIIGGYCSRATVEWALDHVDRGVVRAGRAADELKVSVMVYAGIDDDRTRALDGARWGALVALWSSLNVLDELPLGVDVPDELLDYMRTTQKSFHPEVMQPGMDLIPEELLVPLSLAGTPDDCRAKLRDLAASGGDRIDEVILLPCPATEQTSLDVVTRFAKEVFPVVGHAPAGTVAG